MKGGGAKVSFSVEFDPRELILDRLKSKARDCDLTVEELLKRLVVDAMSNDGNAGPALPGATLEDFLVKNGVCRDK